MLSRIEFKNYRSFLDVKVNLSPFTLVIGANGSGKSNFLRLFHDLTYFEKSSYIDVSPKTKIEYWDGISPRTTIEYWILPKIIAQKHFNNENGPQFICAYTAAADDNSINTISVKGNIGIGEDNISVITSIFDQQKIRLFNFNTSAVDPSEEIQAKKKISYDGKGIVSVLDELKTGDREDLFYEIQTNLIRYIPSIEKISFRISGKGQKSLQVREKGIIKPFPAEKLSEGTKLILMILTILYQENPPKLILLEDIDRGLHPRLFQKVVEMLRDIVTTKDIQIIATTHNPYLVDEFAGEEESVLIVEKQDAVSTITSLAERLDNGNTMEDALGSLWFGGFFGGVPKS